MFTLFFKKIVEERLEISLKTVRDPHPVVMVIRDDNISWIPCYVYYLKKITYVVTLIPTDSEYWNVCWEFAYFIWSIKGFSSTTGESQ